MYISNMYVDIYIYRYRCVYIIYIHIYDMVVFFSNMIIIMESMMIPHYLVVHPA